MYLDSKNYKSKNVKMTIWNGGVENIVYYGYKALISGKHKGATVDYLNKGGKKINYFQQQHVS